MPSFPGETLGGEVLLGKVCHWGRALGQLEGWLSRVWPLVWVGSPLFWASGYEACWEREKDVVFPPQADGVAEDALSVLPSAVPPSSPCGTILSSGRLLIPFFLAWPALISRKWQKWRWAGPGRSLRMPRHCAKKCKLHS